MASLEDLEARVTALEEQVQQSRHDAAAARILAGTADRDVSEFKQTLNGHTKVLNAVRETQIEHGQRLDRLENKLGSVDDRLGTLEAKVDSGLTKINVSMEQMSRLLQQVIDKD
ncbi:hypothetical protein ACWEGE_27380 [Amycolatopsis sp. NPDC004747]